MSVVDEIKDRLDLVEVISGYVPLQKAGRNFRALCPFHAEKTPSFYVFPETQHWHCFGGCSEGGDVFTFVMKREGWDFRTALEELARRAGVELQPLTPAQRERVESDERLRAVLTAAADYFHRLLLHAAEGQAARAYVAERGLDDQTVETFQLGYSMPGWESLRSYLTRQGYTLQELLDAGLLIERDDGSSYDRFRNRLMVPIHDVKGRVIGFGARRLNPEDNPKYLNSPQTPLFDKSRTLFGLHLAREAIRSEDRAIIVEGYMDVMQAWQAGFRNVVAQMGTALTEEQLKPLQRYTKRFVLALDPDAAGVSATLRGLEVARQTLDREWQPIFDPRGLVGHEARLGADIRVLSLPQGYDPDDLVREQPERWAQLVREATPVVDFSLQKLLEGVDLGDSKAKARVVDGMLPLLRVVADPVERTDYAQKVARALQVDARAVLTKLGLAERQAVRRREDLAQRPAEERGLREADRPSYCLAVFLRHPGVLRDVNAFLGEVGLPPVHPGDFEDLAARALLEAWMEGETSVEAMRENLSPSLVAELERTLALEVPEFDERLTRDVARVILGLRQRTLRQRARDLMALVSDAQDTGMQDSRAYGAQSLALRQQDRYIDEIVERRLGWGVQIGTAAGT